jgi:hypothetical protein
MCRISAEYAGNVSPRPICSGLLCALALAGCGGSSHSSTTAVTRSETQQASIAVSTTNSSTTAQTANTTTSAATTTTSASTTHTHTPVAPPPAAGPRVPATFTVLSTGALSPPTVSVPVGYVVQVTFIDHGSATAHAIVHTPRPLDIVAPPGGDGFLLVSRLPKGTYAIDINGKMRGALVIGSAPGP